MDLAIEVNGLPVEFYEADKDVSCNCCEEVKPVVSMHADDPHHSVRLCIECVDKISRAVEPRHRTRIEEAPPLEVVREGVRPASGA